MSELSRVQLMDYSRALGYLNHITLDSTIDNAFMECNNSQINNELIPLLAIKLNASTSSLKQAYHGSSVPMKTLLQAADDIGASNQVDNYIKKLNSKRYTYKKSIASSHGSTRKKRITNPPEDRINLADYIKAICYLQGMSLARFTETMGYTKTKLFDGIYKQSEAQLTNTLLSEAPFTINITMHDIKKVLANDKAPLNALAERSRQRVIDRKTLWQYIVVLEYLHNIHIARKPSLAIAVEQDSREELAPRLKKFSNNLHINLDIPQLLLDANIKKSGHAYLPRMHFIIHYRFAPIGYRQSEKEQRYDNSKVSLHYKNARKLIALKVPELKRARGMFYQKQIFGDLKKQLTWQVWKILTAWNYVYGFDDKRFLTDNFMNYSEKYTPTSVMQNGKAYKITNPTDWMVILHKLHQQLRKVQHAFDLKSVADSIYGKYSYVKGCGQLAHPHQRNYHQALAGMSSKHHTFTAHFGWTRVMRVGSEPYTPCLILLDVKHNGKLVAPMLSMRYTKGFAKLGKLQEDDLIQFNASPREYWTGRYGKNQIPESNYELSYPTIISMLQRKHIRKPQPVPKTRQALVGFCIANDKSGAYDFSIGNYKYIRQCRHAYKIWKNNLK